MDGPLPQENTNGLLAESSMDKQQAHFPDEKLHYKFAIFHAKSDPLGTVTWNSLATTCKAFGNMYGAFSTKFHHKVPSGNVKTLNLWICGFVYSKSRNIRSFMFSCIILNSQLNWNYILCITISCICWISIFFTLLRKIKYLSLAKETWYLQCTIL